MLSVPLKTTVKVDLVEPLQKFIVKSFSKEQLQQHEEALTHLQQMREDVRALTDKSEHVRDVFCRYYGLLEAVEKRFPINEENDDNKKTQTLLVILDKNQFSLGRLHQTQENSILTSLPAAQYSIHYEKANVLFNIGAISSQIAETQNRSTQEGLKKSCHFFQLAAGAFEQLRSYLEQHPQQAVPLDFSADFLNMLINLMLAQAQECFCEQAAKQNSSPSLMSSLTAQAADFYDLARALMVASSLSSYVEASWPQMALVKSSYYKASANHSIATALHAGDKYGDEVARLQCAQSILSSNDLYWPLRAVPQEVQDWFQRLVEVVAKAKAIAEKENNTIYHEPVPTQANLPKLPQRAVVKSLPPGDFTLPREKDPFASLIPFHILQSISIYNEKKASLVREELKQIREHNDFVKGSLFSMNLPASIEGTGDRDPLPHSLREKAKSVRQDGGAASVEELISTLNQLATESNNLLEQAFQVLDQEEEDDKQMRVQYTSSWTRPHSHTLTSSWRQEGAKLRSNLEHAQKSNSFVIQKFDMNRPAIEGLTMSDAELQAVLPAVEDLPPEAVEVADALRESLGYLDACILERNDIETKLKQLAETDDVTGLLLSTPYSHEVIFAEQLRKYEPIQAKLKANLAQQNRLLEMISNENTRFVAIKSRSDQARKRQELLGQLDKAYAAFTELKGNLREGIEFYSNFEDIVTSFRNKCKDFVFARGQEKKDLLAKLQSASSARPPAVGPTYVSQIPQPTFGYQAQPAPGLTRPAGVSDYGPMPGAWQPHMAPVYQAAPQQASPYPQAYPTQQPQQGQSPYYGYRQ